MSYRIVRITTYNSEYLRRYYQRFPNQNQLTYNEQYNHIINDSIEMVSSYSNNLIKLGVDAIDLISNATLLQDTWIKEHNQDRSRSDIELIIEQVKFYKPDIVWIDTTQLLNKKWIQQLRNEVPSIKLVVGHICAPYNAVIGESFHSLDILFTCSPCTAKELKIEGIKQVELIYHSFDHTVLETINSQKNDFPETDFVFTGSLLTGYGLHKTRIEYIEKMIEKKIDICIYGDLEPKHRVLLKQTISNTINFLKSIKANFIIENISLLNKYKQHGESEINYYSKRLINSVKPPVFGLDMYRVLAKSKICFNIHGEIAKKCAGNIRLFEATGTGTCLVTDWKENMPDIFKIDTEVVTYKSLDECIDKVKWLIANPIETAKIAKAGQARTLKDHTVEKRVHAVHDIFEKALK